MSDLSWLWFGEDVNRHQLTEHLLELRGIQVELIGKIIVSDCIVKRNGLRNLIVVDVAERVKVMGLLISSQIREAVDRLN